MNTLYKTGTMRTVDQIWTCTSRLVLHTKNTFDKTGTCKQGLFYHEDSRSDRDMYIQVSSSMNTVDQTGTYFHVLHDMLLKIFMYVFIRLILQ